MLQTRGCWGQASFFAENNLAGAGKTGSGVLSDWWLARCTLDDPTLGPDFYSRVSHCNNLQPPKLRANNIFSDNIPVSFWPLRVFLQFCNPKLSLYLVNLYGKRMKPSLFITHIQEIVFGVWISLLFLVMGAPLEICLSKSIFLSGLKMTVCSNAWILISVEYLYISLANLLWIFWISISSS